MVKSHIFWMIAAIMLLSVPQYTQAESPLASQESMPYITLLDEFKLYKTEKTGKGEVIGSLSPLQSVQLAPMESDRLMRLPGMDKIPVTTWLGTAWINLKEGAYKYGELYRKKETLTLLEPETELYHAPNRSTSY
jgi:hypothetical protein